jgi:hypothetical protein
VMATICTPSNRLLCPLRKSSTLTW